MVCRSALSRLGRGTEPWRRRGCWLTAFGGAAQLPDALPSARVRPVAAQRQLIKIGGALRRGACAAGARAGGHGVLHAEGGGRWALGLRGGRALG
eukprot:CAMPEP_0206269378 /NCGR_PEP_ID=MMETSP0047_2-20121206/32251_1 /ASSEMBLY_ACC=CAM_ASM_000192 /TAXON_ID=195065 /ORGANISM="Chroomonas mesostigmatica_cf, Strain CCMP1168" /LENGTH=94 /DNA_ID=CAMNT_0053697845 /DNA_START=135 /DNA_END=416 /DNA_ORIENTATION=-